jgi:glutamate dehydrogenase (NADP+)
MEHIKFVIDRDPYEREFHQAVTEVVESIRPVLDKNPQYRREAVLERIVEPERVILFRVPWVDDQGQVRVNRGYRIQMNSAIGPLQGRPALSPFGQPLHPQVPCLRAGVQERPDLPAHGRRQGWL